MNENERRGAEGNYVWEGDGGGAGDVTRSSGENGEGKTKAEGRKSAALKREKKKGGRARAKEVCLKSTNKSVPNLTTRLHFLSLNTCSTGQPLYILGAGSTSGRRASFLF